MSSRQKSQKSARLSIHSDSLIGRCLFDFWASLPGIFPQVCSRQRCTLRRRLRRRRRRRSQTAVLPPYPPIQPCLNPDPQVCSRQRCTSRRRKQRQQYRDFLDEEGGEIFFQVCQRQIMIANEEAPSTRRERIVQKVLMFSMPFGLKTKCLLLFPKFCTCTLRWLFLRKRRGK
jgi:hypothetical protein